MHLPLVGLVSIERPFRPETAKLTVQPHSFDELLYNFPVSCYDIQALALQMFSTSIACFSELDITLDYR